MVVGDVTISASPTSTYLGDVITFTGRVLLDGVPASGLWVAIFLDAAPAPPVTLKGGETDVNGYYNIKWTSNYLGNLPIYALAAAYQGFTSPTIIVKIVDAPAGEPYAVIEDFTVPNSLSEGSDVAVKVLLRNAGALGRLDYYIDGNPSNPDNYIMVESGRTPTAVPNGSTVWIDVPIRYFKMPAWDFTLIASNEDGKSYIRRTITLSVGIPTTTTISTPDNVAVDEKFFISGNLYETESGIPIPYQPINHSYNGRSLGGSITGVDGDYLKEISIPETGTWAIKSEFPGTPDYKASRYMNKVTATSPIAMVLQILGPITVGAVLLAYSLG